MTTMALSLGLGAVAGLANVAGGLLLVGRPPSAATLRTLVALGAGFMLAVAMLEMVPEAFALRGRGAALLLLAGYCGVHLLEHAFLPHVHVGEEPHGHVPLSARTSYSVLFGLAMHTFFDGVAIGSGFALSTWLGWALFAAVFLHKVPEGFTVASVMLAAHQGRGRATVAALVLGVTTVAGVLVINAAPGLVRYGLPLSAGVSIYVAASDLVPEVNRQPGWKTSLAFFAGVGAFVVLHLFADR